MGPCQKHAGIYVPRCVDKILTKQSQGSSLHYDLAPSGRIFLIVDCRMMSVDFKDERKDCNHGLTRIFTDFGSMVSPEFGGIGIAALNCGLRIKKQNLFPSKTGLKLRGMIIFYKINISFFKLNQLI